MADVWQIILAGLIYGLSFGIPAVLLIIILWLLHTVRVLNYRVKMLEEWVKDERMRRHGMNPDGSPLTRRKKAVIK